MAKLERHIVTIQALDSANNSTVPVLMTTAIVYTKSVFIGDAVALGVSLTGGTQVAAGSGKQTLVVEQSHELPLVEGSAHSTWITSDTVMTTATWLAAGLTTHCTVTLKGNKYARLKSTAVTPNASANFVAVFIKQVEG